MKKLIIMVLALQGNASLVQSYAEDTVEPLLMVVEKYEQTKPCTITTFQRYQELVLARSYEIPLVLMFIPDFLQNDEAFSAPFNQAVDVFRQQVGFVVAPFQQDNARLCENSVLKDYLIKTLLNQNASRSRRAGITCFLFFQGQARHVFVTSVLDPSLLIKTIKKVFSFQV